MRIKGKKWKLPSKTQGGWLLSATCEVKKDCWMVPVFKDCTDFWTTTNTNSGKEKVYYFVDPKFGGGGFDHKDRKHGVICIATQ